jgi:hypothetical protein
MHSWKYGHTGVYILSALFLGLRGLVYWKKRNGIGMIRPLLDWFLGIPFDILNLEINL